MANISKIKISGTSYSIKDENACKVVELTQAEYNDLPTTAKTSNSLFVITDATAGDLSNYYTKTETDGLLDTKLDVTAYTPTDLSNYYTKLETSGATEISTALESKADTSTTYTKTETDNAITAATSTKQDTLVSGTNIKTINGETLLGEGNITIQGGGGGKAIEAGRGISITTGETADTVSFNLPISAGTGTNSIIEGKSTSAMSYYDHAEGYHTYANGNSYAAHAEGYQTSAMTPSSHAEGRNTKANGNNAHAEGSSTVASGESSHAEGLGAKANGNYSHAEGYFTSASSVSDVSGIDTYFGYQARHAEGYSTLANNASTHTEGYETIANNFGEHASGVYNNSTSATTTWGDSGNTLFSVGNGKSSSARHNAFEIRQNGDIYISKDGQDVKLQDQLGGGGSSYTAGDGIDISNDVISVTGKVDTTTYETYTAATDTALASKQTTLTAGTGISIVDNVISATGGGGGGGLTEDDELLLSTALTDLNDRKIDASDVKSQLGNYQKKGDYATKDYVTTALEPYETKLDEINTEEVTSYALNDLNNKFGGLSLVKITESEYAALTTKDENTLYIVVADQS